MKLKPTQAELADAELWRLFPHTFAVVASKGRWIPYRHLVYAAKRIAAAIARGNGRVIVEMGPRHGKSSLISEEIPEWFLDMRPDGRVMLASYEADYASSWGRKVRNWFESDQGKATSSTRVKGDSHAADRWETHAGGGMVTAGIGGSFTGRGADLLLVDDPHKNWQEAQSATKRQSVIDWFNSTFRTRGEPGATIIVLQTRWHERDLAGYLQSDEEHQDWEIIRLPSFAEANDPLGRAVGAALCPERYDEAALAQIKLDLGSIMFAALHQQRPQPLEGGLFPRKDFIPYLILPETPEWAQTWDLSFDEGEGTAFVSGQVWCKHKAGFYLVDEYHEQANFVAQEKAMLSMHARYPQARTVLVENKANGPAIISRLKKDIPGIKAFNPKGSKETRAASISGFVEAGNVHVPDKSIAPWVDDWLAEVASFPRGALKDRVDAFVQMMLFWSSKSGTGSMKFDISPKTSVLGGLAHGSGQ